MGNPSLHHDAATQKSDPDVTMLTLLVQALTAKSRSSVWLTDDIVKELGGGDRERITRPNSQDQSRRYIQSLSQVYLVEMSDKESTERKHKRGESIANPRRGVGR